MKWPAALILVAFLCGSNRAGALCPLVVDVSEAQTNAVATTRTVRGLVVNGLTGAPLARALVHLNSRSVLTDGLGQFEFPAFGDAQGYASVTKPGYGDAAGAGQMQKIDDLSGQLELVLYPDAIITGRLTREDGQALGKVAVELSRVQYEEGGARWSVVEGTMTDSRGEYRFVQPAGRYRVKTRYMARHPDTGEALLPATFPDNTEGVGSGYFQVKYGQEESIDLRARTSLPGTALLHVEPAGGRGMLRVLALPSSGASFVVAAAPTQNPGVYRVELPPGSYALNLQSTSFPLGAPRGDQGGGGDLLEGRATITVALSRTAEITARLTPVASLPVEVTIDPASSTSSGQTQAKSAGVQDASLQLPNLQQLNLSFHNEATSTEIFNQDVRPRVLANGSAEFRVPSGRYRLKSGGGRSWYVQSATYGTSNLLTDEVAIAPGAGGVPIRLVVSNVRGQLSGTVRLSGSASLSWIYLLPRQPSLAGCIPVIAQPDGSFFWVGPPGSYTVVALRHKAEEDLLAGEVAAGYRAGGKTVEITAGGKTSVDLDLYQPTEAVR